MIHPCFCIRSTSGQLNVQAATAEDEKQNALNKIIHIKFQNC